MQTARNINELLAELYRRNIRISVENERLKVAGPEEAIDDSIQRELKANKAAILAHLQSQQSNHSKDSIRPRAVTVDSTSLSFAQLRLWFLEQLQPDTAAYNLPLAVEVHGQLDQQALRASIQSIFERHDVLRTNYVSSIDEPVQQILEHAELNLDTVDYRSEPNSKDLVMTAARHAALSPFNLAQEAPIRIALFHCEDDVWVILLTLHHIAADAWSIEILLHELSILYPAKLIGAEPLLPTLPIQYADFASWQRSEQMQERLGEELDYWRKQLNGDLPRLQLPTDFARPRTQTFNGAVVEFKLSNEVTKLLKQLAQKHNASLFMCLLAALNLLLYRYSGQRDLLVGTPVANRQRPEVQNLIGLFVNTLVIRTQIDPSCKFSELLNAVRETTLAAYDHQDLPFEHLVEALAPERDPSFSPLFQVKFRLENAPADKVDLPGISLKRMPQQVTLAKLDLSIDMYETVDGLTGGFEYNTDLFQKPTIERMASQFSSLLERLATHSQKRIADISILTDTEYVTQQLTWNDSAKPYQHEACYHQLFEAQADQHPEAIAVIAALDTEEQLSYSQLNQRANQLAHALIQHGVGTEQIVAICLHRSPEMVVAMLAVLKAGGAYLPLDANYPQERLTYMLEHAEVQVLLSSSDIEMPAVENRLDLDQYKLTDFAITNPITSVTPDNLAYVIYTSGSTGKPKGVLIPHRGLINLTEDKIRKCDVRLNDCVLQFFSFSFDGSVPEFVMTLAVGAHLLIAPAATMIPGPELRDLLLQHDVTHITMTPSALTALPHGEYPKLRMVLVGGEAPSPELIQHWGKNRHFINAYGPTETTVNASMVHCGNGNPLEPTVLPSANKQLYILDEDLQIVPIGAIGELHIAGIGIARGYLNHASQTAERFLPNPFAGESGETSNSIYPARTLYKSGDLATYLPDGRIKLLGRIDTQTKIRGFRIELGEIERTLEQHPDIHVAVVILKEHAGDKRLLAYAVANHENHESAAEVCRFLSTKLPQFMVPSGFAWLPKLPMTSNGKLDLEALPLPTQEHQSGRTARNENEKFLTELFSEVLAVSQISIDDNFFDLGGHSLLATKLVARCQEHSGVDITVLDLFDSPTIAGLALRIEQKQHLNQLLRREEDEDEEREEIAL